MGAKCGAGRRTIHINKGLDGVAGESRRLLLFCERRI